LPGSDINLIESVVPDAFSFDFVTNKVKYYLYPFRPSYPIADSTLKNPIVNATMTSKFQNPFGFDFTVLNVELGLQMFFNDTYIGIQNIDNSKHRLK